MPTITVKKIPLEIYDKLKQSAKTSHRSNNSEIIACIEKAVLSQSVNPDQLLANARKLRSKTAGHPIADSAFARAKTAGRL